MVITRAFVGGILFCAVLAWAGPPLLPPRDYSTTVVALTGDEAVALKTATEAMLKYLEKQNGKPSICKYYATIQRRAPSFWLVEWSLNDGDARGGGIDVTLDVTGTQVVSVKRVE